MRRANLQLLARTTASLSAPSSSAATIRRPLLQHVSTMDSYNNNNSLVSQRRQYSVTKKTDAAPLIIGGIGIIIAAAGAQYGIEAYTKFTEQRAAAAAAAADKSGATSDKTKAGDANEASATAEMFNFSSTWFARNFYDGGFEDKMTKREAALILGVRESATSERIKDAHRRILVINHPDKGGSAYLGAKINEAKDLLLKGK